MPGFTTTEWIPRPPNDVFDFITTPKNAPKVMGVNAPIAVKRFSVISETGGVWQVLRQTATTARVASP